MIQRFHLYLLPLCFLTFACGKKDLSIEPGKVKAVLEQYGKENPEHEVVIHTSEGDIFLTLFDETPLHRANFIRLIKNGYYNNSHFYRVVSSFMIQGGSIEGNKPNYLVPNEIKPNLLHMRGALAMARYDENNPELNSSPSEFYIVQGRRFLNEDLDELKPKYTPEQLPLFATEGGAPNLDGKYTVFGKVTKGMDVVEKIAAGHTNTEETPDLKIKFSVEVVK